MSDGTPYRDPDEPMLGSYPLRMGRDWMVPVALTGAAALLTLVTRGRFLCFILVLPLLGLTGLRGPRVIRVFPSRVELLPLLGPRRIIPTRELHVAPTGTGLVLSTRARATHIDRSRFHTEEAFQHFSAAVRRVARPD